MDRVELVQWHPADFYLAVIRVNTLRGFIIFIDFALEIEFNLVHFRTDSRKFVLTGAILPDEKQLAHFHACVDLFLTFAFESIGQSFTPFLTSARQDGVGSFLIPFEDHKQFPIPNDDSFNGVADFLFLCHDSLLDFTLNRISA